MPAAQASFMAKSTTTPFSMEMNLESWPPISKMVSTGSPPSVLLMWMAPVLCAVISSLTTSAPTNSAISSRPEPVVPTPRISQPAAPQPLDFGQALLHGLDGPAGGAQVDIVDHRAEFVDRHHVGGNRADIEPEIGRDGLAVGRRHVHAHAVAQLHHVLRGERVRVLHRLFGIVLAQAVDLQDGALARLLGFQNGRADGAAPGVLLGHEQVVLGQREGLAQRAGDAGVLRDRADQRHRRLDRPALHDGALEIARHRVAQAAQNLGRRVALLLRVDHVALGEHRAAAGDARARNWPSQTTVAHFLHRVLHAQRLLVEERPGAGRAFAGAVVIHDAAAVQADVLGAFAADFEHRAHLRVERRRSCARWP